MKSNVIYPNVPLAIKPVPHSEILQIPAPPKSFNALTDSDHNDSHNSSSILS